MFGLVSQCIKLKRSVEVSNAKLSDRNVKTDFFFDMSF